MENSLNLLPEEQKASIQADIDAIIFTRRQLFHFIPTESNLVMTFSLADGQQVPIPIQDPYKVRMLVGEVRNYLEEQELANERKLNKLKVNPAPAA